MTTFEKRLIMEIASTLFFDIALIIREVKYDVIFHLIKKS